MVDGIEDAALRRGDSHGAGEHLNADVVRLMHFLTEGEATRSVSEQIATLVEALYAIYAEAPPEAWKSLAREKLLAAGEVAAAIDALQNAVVPSKSFAKALTQEHAAAP